jgi:hypothetical protein
MKIFYSWQSDIDQKINRYFIQEALLKITKNFEKENILNIEIDQATRDEPGTPDIANTIFKKIDECSIFVADISFINSNNETRRTPNPNVLIELGYAIKKIGFEKIILIFNNEFGAVDKLPFDINHRRPMQYLYNSSMDKKIALDDLITKLENAILLIDRKTMTQEKVDFGFYNRNEGKQQGKKIIISGIVYKMISEDEVLEGIDFNVIRKMKNEMKFTEWQEYLYEKAKTYKERKDALATMRGMRIIQEGFFENSFETKDYYKKYMAASLLLIDTHKINFFVRNNNEQTLKNIKIVLRTDKENRIRREIDLPILPLSTTIASMTYRGYEDTEQILFQRKEYGNYTTFEYMKDNLYADEEFILDEPLFIPLRANDLIKIECSIFAENLPNTKGDLEIKLEKEDKVLTPMDAFTKL